MNIKLSMDKVYLFAYFIGLSILGSIILSFPFAYVSGESPHFIDVLFTTVSALCVTGLSTLSMDIYTTAGFWIIMLLIELGGLGIISFISFYIAGSRRKVSLVNRVIVQQYFIEDLETNPRKIVRSIILFTVLLELIAAVIMYNGFLESGSNRPFFDALFHAVSAFCNAGFSTYNDSLAGFYSTPVITWTIIFLIVTGGLGFMVITDIRNRIFRRNKRLSTHSIMVIRVTLILIGIGVLAQLLFDYSALLSDLSLSEKCTVVLFHSITPRTAGFSLIEQQQFSPVFQMITMILMFIGGSPGSIAGGIKTTTFAIVFIYAIRGNVERKGLNIGARNIDTPIIEKAFNIMAKSLMIIMGSILLLLVVEADKISAGDFTLFAVAFETVSAFATVGLSQGITSDLSITGKAVIIATMFIGRTGVVAMAAGFFRNERERFIEYPSAGVAVG